MDLTPPLTRSPASPPNSYCPSESSSLDYPSPELAAQQYKISSIYGADPPCSMAPPMDSETSLPPLDAEWGQTLQPSSTATAMPTILSAEYDPFGNYGSPLPGAYGHDVYATHHSQEPSIAGTPPPGGHHHSRSPVAPASRSPLTYAAAAPVSSHMPGRVKLEAPTSDYGQAVEVSHYPSPRSVHAPYPTDTGAYPPTTAGYLSDSQSPAWAQPVEPEQYYAAPTSQAQGLIQDRTFSRMTRSHRRPPRHLTTKEEANFQCEVKGCGKLFSRSYNFKAHMETHDEKREYPFPCQVNDCNKKFVRKTDLQRHHQSVHMKERNHRCDYCGRLFARKDTLRRHMDDGCSKRFDIGTLDLRTEGYDNLNSNARPMGSSMNHLVPPTSALPPLAVPSIGGGSLLAPVPPPLRNRGMIGSNDPNQAHGWGR